MAPQRPRQLSKLTKDAKETAYWQEATVAEGLMAAVGYFKFCEHIRKPVSAQLLLSRNEKNSREHTLANRRFAFSVQVIAFEWLMFTVSI
jgi:hypothetical protein